MNYTDLMDSMAKKTSVKSGVRIPFPVDGKVGQLQQATVAFRILSQDLEGAVIQMLDFKIEDEKQETNDPAPRPHIIPCPS